jgi:hypothetical protein
MRGTGGELLRRLPNRPAFAEKWDDALTEIVFHLSFNAMGIVSEILTDEPGL